MILDPQVQICLGHAAALAEGTHWDTQRQWLFWWKGQLLDTGLSGTHRNGAAGSQSEYQNDTSNTP